MPFTDLRRAAAVAVTVALLAACASKPVTTDGDEEASVKVAEKAESALFSGSLFGGKRSKKDDTETAVEKPAEGEGVSKKVGGPTPQVNLPMVLAPGAEKDAKAAKSQYTQALAAIKNGNDEQALVLLRDISNRHPNLSGPLLNQAILLRKKGRLEEAQDLLKKSMLSPTQNPRVMNELGVVSRQLGNFKQAKSAYESAIRLAPGYDRPHYNLAVLADLYLGDAALAIKEFEMFQSLQEKRDKKVDGWLKELKRRGDAP